MKKIFTTLFLTTMTSLMSTSLNAASFQLQNIRVGGLGCPSELTQIILAPDMSAASLIFSQFEARVPVTNAGPKVQRNISILNCNIFVDVKVPAGLRLESMDISYDMRGYAGLDRGVIGSFRSYLMSKSGMGLPAVNRGGELLAEKNWSNTTTGQDEDFIITTTKSLSLASRCALGSSSDVVSVRLQNTLTGQILSGFETSVQGSITVDTSDVTGGLKLSAHGSSCNVAPTPDRNGTSAGRNCRIVRGRQVCS